jgi:hypothetical protein
VFNEGQSPEAREVRKAKELAKGYNSNGGGEPLAYVASQWPTPDVTQGRNLLSSRQADTEHHHGATLNDAVETWPSPAARDFKEPNSRDHATSGRGRKHMDQLPNFVMHSFGPRHQEQASCGPPSSSGSRGWLRHFRGLSSGQRLEITRSRRWQRKLAAEAARCPVPSTRSSFVRRLNPLFVSWLMGMPVEQIGFALSATHVSRYKQRWRSEFSRIV